MHSRYFDTIWVPVIPTPTMLVSRYGTFPKFRALFIFLYISVIKKSKTTTEDFSRGKAISNVGIPTLQFG